ncbi:adenosylcobinamide-GDP ribazoletransferase [Streptomyces sp. NBC_01497]|uniref:adenosylcobinamide-GDP ribazoletransferase n=1 Tax=Streptomyces sp. NBC_01497 TaxID=2903885 RepID=UPI002E3540F1|nr:adenosylcobinamide-GDP ribazoletransferase [Streptomyces sp. NBC_01497]
MADSPTASDSPDRAALGDGLRFAVGTLTVLPVRVTRWDRPAARLGMLAAPLAGLVVGAASAAVATVLWLLGTGALLAAAGAVAVPAALTRGLHLDGLADTADGLGSGRPAEDALRVMKQSDIGPFGVVTLVLVLLAQTAAVARIYDHGPARAAVALALAAVSARAVFALGCRAGVPAARPGGLGAAVAGTVPARAAVLALSAVVLAAAAAGSAFSAWDAVRDGLAVLFAAVAAELLLRHCVRRFGGITGDVLGALCETAATVALVVLAAGPS